VLTGTGQVHLLGPGPGDVNPEIQSRIVVAARVHGATTYSVAWRGPGAEFSRMRCTPDVPIPSTDQLQSLITRMSTLRGIHGEPGADQGVEELRLRFSGPPGAPITVAVDQIALLSDFDDPGGHGFTTGTLQRAGVQRPGVALRTGVTVSTGLPALPAGRLGLALAAVGSSEPLQVTLRSSDGSLPAQQLTVAPGADWVEHALDLGPAEAPRRLQLAVAPGEPQALLFVGSVMLLQPATTPRPDLLLYVEDTLRADHLSTFGGSRPTDPWLASCAAQGAAFTRVWSSSNWTRPAICTIFTGLDPAGHGVVKFSRRVPDELVTLAEALADAGYVTASFVTNYQAGSWAGLQQGFDVEADASAYGATTLHSTLTSAAIAGPLADFLREHADEQVFVYAHSLDPHAPYEPPPELEEQLVQQGPARQAPADMPDAARWSHDTLAYDAEILHNDGQLARLDQALGELALRDSTLFAFVADHGEQFGDHGAWEHHQNLHDEETRVPLVLRLPGRIAPGQHLDEPAGLRDLAPTLLALLGCAAPAGWQGRDLSPLLLPPAGAPPPPGQRPRAEPQLIDTTYDEPPYNEPPRGVPREVALVAWPWKVLAALDQADRIDALRPTGLYDLSADPGERQNLIERADLAPQLEALLALARERLAVGPAAPGAAADAAAMDPALRQWLQAMGYVR